MSSPSRLDLDRFRKKGDDGATNSPEATEAAMPGPRVNVVAKERRQKAILASIETLPSLPSVVTEVLTLVNDDAAGARDFEEIISKDQALTAKVLKLVNSPFFGQRGSISTIPQAIVVLGFKSLRSVVLAAKTSRLLDRQLIPYGIGDGGLWKHSMSCATLAGRIAKRLCHDQEAQESAFVGGLLHDVGKIILAPHIAEQQTDFDRVREEAGGDVVQAERITMGMSHPEAAGLMGQRWALPAHLIDVIAGHHSPLPAEGADAGALVVRVANDLCNQLGVGRLQGPAEPTADWSATLVALGLKEAEDDLRQECAELLVELAPVFAEMAGR